MKPEELRALAEKATPGPWTSDLDQFDDDGPVALVLNTDYGLFAQLATNIPTTRPERRKAIECGEWTLADDEFKNDAWMAARASQQSRDAAYIAAASPDRIIALLDELAAVGAENERLRALTARVELTPDNCNHNRQIDPDTGECLDCGTILP